jgi:hypothetical protein
MRNLSLQASEIHTESVNIQRPDRHPLRAAMTLTNPVKPAAAMANPRCRR